MIYLLLKMFLYLILAMAAGGGAGWLLRNLAAIKREEELSRALTDAKARVPQFEAQLRSREDQGKRTREEMATKERVIAELMEEIKSKEEALREKDRELKKLAVVSRQETLPESENSTPTPGSSDILMAGEMMAESTLDYADVQNLSAATPLPAATPLRPNSLDRSLDSDVAQQLRDRIPALEQELAQARAVTADAVAEAAAAEAEVVTLKAELARRTAQPSVDAAVTAGTADLEARLRQKAEEHERLNRSLETEKRKVVELERERELQNKSLQVLHQQLELERERGQRAANG